MTRSYQYVYRLTMIVTGTKHVCSHESRGILSSMTKLMITYDDCLEIARCDGLIL